jgi:hypothetical protein
MMNNGYQVVSDQTIFRYFANASYISCVNNHAAETEIIQWIYARMCLYITSNSEYFQSLVVSVPLKTSFFLTIITNLTTS